MELVVGVPGVERVVGVPGVERVVLDPGVQLVVVPGVGLVLVGVVGVVVPVGLVLPTALLHHGHSDFHLGLPCLVKRGGGDSLSQF